MKLLKRDRVSDLSEKKGRTLTRTLTYDHRDRVNRLLCPYLIKTAIGTHLSATGVWNKFQLVFTTPTYAPGIAAIGAIWRSRTTCIRLYLGSKPQDVCQTYKASKADPATIRCSIHEKLIGERILWDQGIIVPLLHPQYWVHTH